MAPGPGIPVRNLFRDLPPASPEEAFEVLASRGAVRIERIVSRGHASPPGFWYDQDECEWVVLLAGRATLRFTDPDETADLHAGDAVFIPAHRRHRVDATGSAPAAIWLAVFFPDAPEDAGATAPG